jgi:hypothetical protein
MARFESLSSLTIAYCPQLTGAGWGNMKRLKFLNAAKTRTDNEAAAVLHSLEFVDVLGHLNVTGAGCARAPAHHAERQRLCCVCVINR